MAKKTEEKNAVEKAKKTKKEPKKVAAKKLPRMLKKSYSAKKLDSSVLNRLYIPADKKAVKALFETGANPKKPELLAVSREMTFTKAEIKHYKKLVKEIKKQKSIFSFVPFVAVAGVIAAVGMIVTVFKNPITKKILIAACQSAAGAKTEIRSVNLEIFGTSLTVNRISVGNKDSEMKNIFEAEKIEVAFSLTQALRGKFDCKNIEVSGMAFNTDRTTSCRLPAQERKAKKEAKKDAESPFMIAVKQRSELAMDNLKSKATSMLGGSNPEEIVKNLESQLKTPVIVKETRETSEEMIAKWKGKPDQLKKQVEDFSSSVQKLQTINPSSIKDVATLKSTLETLNAACTKGKEIQNSAVTIVNEVQNDGNKVVSLGEKVKQAAEADLNFAQSTIGSAVDNIKNAKSLMNDALETVACSMLGNYYPYFKKGIAYAEKMKAESADKPKTEKKEKADKKTAAKKTKTERKRLAGTTFWYSTTKPSFLIERIFASGENFDAKITDISNDQNLLGKPMAGTGNFTLGKTSHNASLVIDARKASNAKLVTVSYSGKGFNADIDGAKICAANGIPSIAGTVALSMKGSFDSGYFLASGNVDVNPVKLTSDGFENEMLTKYYNKALSSVNRLTAGYKAEFSESKGVDLNINGNFADQFARALQSVIMEIGDDAKKIALKKINETINNSSNEALAKVKEFAGIKGDIDVQNANLASIQKILENKRSQIEAEIKNRANSAAKDALEKANLPPAAGDAASKLLKKLPF